jgi:hypothetical protein
VRLVGLHVQWTCWVSGICLVMGCCCGTVAWMRVQGAWGMWQVARVGGKCWGVRRLLWCKLQLQ